MPASKRKQDLGDNVVASKADDDSGDDEVRSISSCSILNPSPADPVQDFDVLNVEFEWFDPQPEFDFHGIKTLLQQLFDADGQLFELSALTDLILSQPTLGSTVKVDGNETDAYAFLSILNLQEHKASLDTGITPNSADKHCLGQTFYGQNHPVHPLQSIIQTPTCSSCATAVPVYNTSYWVDSNRAPHQRSVRGCPSHVHHAA